MDTYQKLLSPSRRQASTVKSRDIAEEAASDQSRVIYSSPFRRLQQKAQVFSLERNAAVRSRMTHTLEVADVGRHIARQIAKEIDELKNNINTNEAFVTFIETGCLLHDIGNPPFGHFGEAAIQKWFGENWEACAKKSLGNTHDLIEELETKIEDFIQFDGNPQGVRIITRLQYDRDQFSLNLTYTQIATALKYVRSTSDPKGDGINKKPGYFQSEEYIIKEVRDKLGIEPMCRFPLAYIVEAADDIAYCISDIEDGIEKNILNTRDVALGLVQEWKRITNNDNSLTNSFPFELLSDEFVKKPYDAIARTGFNFLEFKTKFARALIKRAAELYIKNEQEILSGKKNELLGSDQEAELILDLMKTMARHLLFRSIEAERIELTGYSVIKGLLECYRPLLECCSEDFEKLCRAQKDPGAIKRSDQLDVEWRLFNKLPKNHVNAYLHHYNESRKNPSDEWFLRAHLITDYICGMTDRFALDTYQELLGVSIG